jgi:hypothetical protein
MTPTMASSFSKSNTPLAVMVPMATRKHMGQVRSGSVYRGGSTLLKGAVALGHLPDSDECVLAVGEGGVVDPAHALILKLYPVVLFGLVDAERLRFLVPG